MENKETEARKSLQEMTDACIAAHPDNITDSRMCIIDAEMRGGFEMMAKYPRSVTIFGSARLTEESPIFTKVQNLAQKIADIGYAVVTGGGYGLMGAANRGAKISGKGASLGINISLPFEQTLNDDLIESVEFHHFFSRKVALAYSAEVFVFCPGGFGTLDEFFEILTLKQTRKIPNIPIILYGSSFWKPLEEFFEKVLLKEGNETISKEDIGLYLITDDDTEIIEIIKNAPVRSDISSTHHLGQ